MTRPLSNKPVFLAVLAFLLSVGAVVSPSQAQAADPWFDTTNRDAVVAAYNAEFGGPTPPMGWTGSRSSCSPGTTSQEFRDSIFSRINWYRSMAGVPAGVTENVSRSAAAQQGALMNAENGKISHNVTQAAFPECYTTDGDNVALESNLYLGKSGPDAISGYVTDPGSNNVKVGHRSWILHPTTRQMGTGDIPTDGGWSANVLWVFDSVFAAQPELREADGFVAWPPRGYVPGEVVSPRWSFSIRGANFDSATVSVTSGGNSVPVSVIYRDSSTNSAPFPLVVWEPAGINLAPTRDTAYRVTVSGVVVNGATRSFSYDTIILGDQPGDSIADPVSEHGDYVNQAYRDFLGRDAQANELSSWSGRLASGTSRFEFVDSLSNSAEWTGVVVDGLYLNTLGRIADSQGREFWSQKLSNGLPVANLASSFYGSQEYVNRQGGDIEPWVGELYRVLLGRDAEATGTNFWVTATAQTSTDQVAFALYQSEENRRLRVRGLYQQFLGREPDPGGLLWWTDVLSSGDDLQLAAFLASSDEYVARAGR